jgi:hypothetical protein
MAAKKFFNISLMLQKLYDIREEQQYTAYCIDKFLQSSKFKQYLISKISEVSTTQSALEHASLTPIFNCIKNSNGNTAIK